MKFVLNGSNLTPESLVALGDKQSEIELSNEAKQNVEKANQVIRDIVQSTQVVYGINTGFGKFARTRISKENLKKLQYNLIRSHACGVGDALPFERTKRLLALRINVLCKGYSGISFETLQKIVKAFNLNCISKVPEKGTVGASGDLAQLAHLALGLLGEGDMWDIENKGWKSASSILEAKGLEPLDLGPKEGLALINGTQFITALGSEALIRGENIARQADIVAAISLEVQKGSVKAFDADLHLARPHSGQLEVARRMRSLLHSNVYPSEIYESHRECDQVQDSYTFRCIPQVHGIVADTLNFVRSILDVELNAATDNPMVFGDRKEVISGGNFHGEYPAKVLDYLAIAVNELGLISERRIERLNNPAYSQMPAFLVKNGGLNSGFMMAHCTAAAVLSENKVLCHPSSSDNASTSAGQEDHVSMGGFSARKALTVVEHVEVILAVELLCACQGLEFLRPLKTTKPLENVYNLVRSVVKSWDEDRFMAPDIEAAMKLLQENKLWEVVQQYSVENSNGTHF